MLYLIKVSFEHHVSKTGATWDFWEKLVHFMFQ